MAVAGLFAKIDELEKKLQNMNVSDTKPLENRISELEAQITQMKTLAPTKDLEKKVNDLSVVLPTISQISERLAKVEAKAIDTGVFLEKVNNLETNVVSRLVSRIEALEQKFASLTPA